MCRLASHQQEASGGIVFHVDYPEDPLPEMFLQHVLNEGQRIAVVLRLGVWAAVVEDELPLPGHLFGKHEAEGGPLGVIGLKAACVNELPRDVLYSLFPLAPETELPVPVKSGVGLQLYLGLAIRSTDLQVFH